MRKKEQIWKRLNRDQEKAVDAWLWGMGTLTGLLILSAVFWSWIYRQGISSSPRKFFHPGWSKAVLGSWLFFTLPLLVWMYRTADQIFRNALERQTETTSKFRTAFLDRNKRLLPQAVSDKIKTLPETLEGGHVVTVHLKDGRKVPHVFVREGMEILGVYGQREFDFEAQDIIDITVQEELIPYEESKWLRLDGRA